MSVNSCDASNQRLNPDHNGFSNSLQNLSLSFDNESFSDVDEPDYQISPANNRRDFLKSSREIIIRETNFPHGRNPSLEDAVTHQSVPPNSLQGIPDELKIYVMSFMNLPTIAVVSRVNKKWHSLSNRSILWQTLCIRDFESCSLTDTITSWKELYKDISTPLDLDPRFQRCCYGYLGEAQAKEKLKGKPVGTFLFRSSSTDNNAITISFVSANDQIRHRRMYKLYDGGYSFHIPSYLRNDISNNNNNILLHGSMKKNASTTTTTTNSSSERIYKTYFHLIRYNTNWLKIPLVAETDASVLKNNYSEKQCIDIYCPDTKGPPSSAEINIIAQTLRENNTIATELRIRANTYYGFSISLSDTETILSALESNTTVKTVKLAHMHMNLVLCYAVARLLQRNKTIIKLGFHHCSFDIQSPLAIIQSLPLTKTLECLILNGQQFTASNFMVTTESDFTQFECLPWKCNSIIN